LSWKVPANWEELPAQGMRVGSFVAKGSQGKVADVSIVPLGGLAGGILGNVNRWRGQVGLPAVSEGELAKLSQPVEIAGQKAQLFEEAGTSDNPETRTNILGAILERSGTSWFFKMIGKEAVVTEQKPLFLEFLKSVKFDGGGAEKTLPPSHPPINSGNPTRPAPSESNDGKPKWKVPSGWQEAPASQFVAGKFLIAGDNNATAAVTVSNARGGLTQNVNRWRGQLGMSPLAADEIEKHVQPLAVPAGKAMLIEMSGRDSATGQNARLVAAVVQQSDNTWYYKLMGDEKLVDREKQAFIDFVKSAIYP
jgi:hypothetical protein